MAKGGQSLPKPTQKPAGPYASAMQRIEDLINSLRERKMKQFSDVIQGLHAVDPYGSSALEKQMARSYLDLNETIDSATAPLISMQMDMLTRQGEWQERQREAEEARREAERERGYQRWLVAKGRGKGGGGATGGIGGTILNPGAIAGQSFLGASAANREFDERFGAVGDYGSGVSSGMRYSSVPPPLGGFRGVNSVESLVSGAINPVRASDEIQRFMAHRQGQRERDFQRFQQSDPNWQRRIQSYNTLGQNLLGQYGGNRMDLGYQEARRNLRNRLFGNFSDMINY